MGRGERPCDRGAVARLLPAMSPASLLLAPLLLASLLLAALLLASLLLVGCEAGETADGAAGGASETAPLPPDAEPLALIGRNPVPVMIDAGIGVVSDIFVLGHEAIVATRTGFTYRVDRLQGRFALVPVPEIVGRPPAPDPVRPVKLLPQSRGVPGDGSIAAAWLIAPTDRYAHAVLGDALEAGGLLVRRRTGDEVMLTLPDQQVFEDLTPRITDLDRDGRAEVLVVRSGSADGAALVLYGFVGNSLVELAATAPIGRPNRWLNPIGVGDFDGDDLDEVAYVETPHRDGTLRILDYRFGRFAEIASARGFSNHSIGARVLDQAAVIDWDYDGRDDLAVPTADRRGIVVLALRSGTLEEFGRVNHGSEIVTPVVAANVDDDRAREVVYGLENGHIVILDD